MKQANLAASEVFQAQIFKKSVRYISRNRANLKKVSKSVISRTGRPPGPETLDLQKGPPRWGS